MARFATKLVCEISEKAWSAKGNWDRILAECFEHACPDRNPYYDNGTGQPTGSSVPKGQDKSSKRVYDSTLMSDAEELRNKLQSELFSIGSEWASLKPGPFVDQSQQDKARQDLHRLQKTMFAAIQFSNFDLSISEWLLELVVAGTACMLTQKGNEQHPIVYQAVPQSHVALREGAFGFIDAICRKHKMRHSLIKQTWTDAKEVSAEDIQASDSKDDDPELDLIEVTYLDHLDMIWRYDVIILGGNTNAKLDKRRIVERDFKVNPWSIARWSKAAGEVQGRSIVMSALPDARVLSAVKKYLLQQAALSIGGVFLVRNDGVINANSIRIFPGATIPVQSTGGGNAGASISPLEVGGRLDMTQILLQDLVQSIHKIMLNDGIPDIKDGIRTATEWIERLKKLQQSVGAPFARVLKEGVVPMLESTLQVLGEFGVVQLPEAGVIKLNSGQIAVTFSSPLVQQQSLREVEAVVNASNITRQIVGVQGGDQAVALAYKIEDAGAWVGQKVGVVPSLIRSEAERKQLQEQAGAAAAAQAANENTPPQVGGQGGVTPQLAA